MNSVKRRAELWRKLDEMRREIDRKENYGINPIFLSFWAGTLFKLTDPSPSERTEIYRGDEDEDF